MTVNPFASLSVTSTTPSRAAKPVVSASSEAFDAMVADVMADEDAKTVTSIDKASADAAPVKTDDTPKGVDTSIDDTSEDAGYPELLSAATLFVVQPQAPQPSTDAAGDTDTIKTASAAPARTEPRFVGADVDVPQNPVSDTAVFAAASNPAQITTADPDIALAHVDPTNAASAIAPNNPAQIAQEDTPAPLLQTAALDNAATAVTREDEGRIASADTNLASVKGADADSALFVAGPKAAAPVAVTGPRIDQPTAGTTADGQAVALVQNTPSSGLPHGAETEQTAAQPTISNDADQTPGPAYAVQASTTGSVTSAPARKAGAAVKDAGSNASAGAGKIAAQPTATSDEAKAGSSPPTVSGQSAVGLAQTGQASPSATTSAFAAQVQAQAQANVSDPGAALTTDTLPSVQGQQTAQTNTIANPPVVASFSGLSRATLETTVQIAAQITRQLAGRSTRFEMGLTPEGLGKVNVSMDIDASGQLTAQLAFDNPLAAADLRGRADELRSQLQDAGFKLADDALTFSQQDTSSRDGGSADQRPDQNPGRAFAAASRMADDADVIPPVPAWVSLSLTPRGVDMKV